MHPSDSQDYPPNQPSPPPSPPPQSYCQPPYAPPQQNDQPPHVISVYICAGPQQNYKPPCPIPGPPMVAPTYFINSDWSSSLCACCSDVPNCCLTCWCPCITFGQIAEIVDKGKNSCAVYGILYAVLAAFTCCGCLYSCIFRTKMRSQYGVLHETPCNDCLVHCFCELCALCQEYRELKHRGFDISIGWQGNMERYNNGVQMPPRAPVMQR